ncbi:hypothetical protein BC828DRAFT_388830 [Blastocladiella britannica]|nr:hypothetical protein BC828DRAFT_388830 [Blastocladiella britannica]
MYAPESGVQVLFRFGTPPVYIGTEQDGVLRAVASPNSFCVWTMTAFEGGFFSLTHPTKKVLVVKAGSFTLAAAEAAGWEKMLKLEPVPGGAADGPGADGKGPVRSTSPSTSRMVDPNAVQRRPSADGSARSPSGGINGGLVAGGPTRPTPGSSAASSPAQRPAAAPVAAAYNGLIAAAEASKRQSFDDRAPAAAPSAPQSHVLSQPPSQQSIGGKSTDSGRGGSPSMGPSGPPQGNFSPLFDISQQPLMSVTN